MSTSPSSHTDADKDALTLWGAVSMGTGAMIGAGIFALTGQMAELAGSWFPLAFLLSAAVALGILAYKDFTTITNSGGALRKPEKNVGRAIMIALSICTVLYLFVALATGANLSISLKGLILVFVLEHVFLRIHGEARDDPNYHLTSGDKGSA